MHQLIKTVNEWSNHQRLYENTSSSTQLALAYIELGELGDALMLGNSRVDCALELGDVMTCLINYCIMEKPELLMVFSNVLNNSETRIKNLSLSNDIVSAFGHLKNTEFFIVNQIPKLAGIVGESPAECLRLTCNKIKFRKGMFKNGKFSKL